MGAMPSRFPRPLLPVAAFILFLCMDIAPAPAGDAGITLDTAGADAWIACMEAGKTAPDSCEAGSASTLGGQLAELAIPTFGSLPAERPADPPVERVAALRTAIRGWDIGALAADIAGLFPPQEPFPIRIFLVGNGVPVWGDMYVRTYAFDGGKPRLDDAGEPIILINARLNAAYPGSAESLAKDTRDVVRHELFHVVFSRFRSRDPGWRRLDAPDRDSQLLLMVEDEGIAHFLAMQDQWRQNGFPEKRATAALSALTAAVEAISAGTATEETLQKANEGPFWEKYGAISGALFAYGIDKTAGEEGLRRSLIEGPASFILRYDAATAADPALPPLPDRLRRWANAHPH
ncbi:MAG: hypothetical protein F8N37_22770 [Telmatospirillum sp.]|nr:hypothetical protein [Telmatospirillum sp.]